jgi:hypothetical protein
MVKHYVVMMGIQLSLSAQQFMVTRVAGDDNVLGNKRKRPSRY